MRTPSTRQPLSPEDLTLLQETLIKLVREARSRRGLWQEFEEAFWIVLDLSDTCMSPEHQRLYNAADRLPDDAVRLVAELMNTAAFMQTLGEFPAPDEANDADSPDAA